MVRLLFCLLNDKFYTHDKGPSLELIQLVSSIKSILTYTLSSDLTEKW